MVKWYHVFKVTRHRAKVLTHDHVTTLADESASALYRGEVVSWCHSSVVSWCRGSVATNYHSSSAPENIRAWGELEASIRARSELESCELRAGAATKNLT